MFPESGEMNAFGTASNHMAELRSLEAQDGQLLTPALNHLAVPSGLRLSLRRDRRRSHAIHRQER